MATQKVRDGLAAGFSLDEIRGTAAEEYREGVAAGYTREEMDKYVEDEYGLRFSYNPDSLDDVHLLGSWINEDPEEMSKASITEQVEDITLNDKLSQDLAQKQNQISNEWAKMEADPFMRRGTRAFSDTELADEKLYKARDTAVYKAEDDITSMSEEQYQQMRSPDYAGPRYLTTADRARQDQLLQEGKFSITPDQAEPDYIGPASSSMSQTLQAGTKWNPVREASGILDSAMSGYQGSVTGLYNREAMPNIVMAPDATMPERISHTLGTMVGDLPTFVPGAVAGGAVTAETFVGAVPGAVAGGMALTEGIKQHLMLRYTRGEVKDFQDLMSRTGSVTWAATKGGATGFVGGYAGGIAGRYAASGLMATGMSESASTFMAQNLARPVAEIGTFTTAGAALNGQVPTSEDFLVGLGTWGLTKAGGFYTSKLKDTYVQSDVTPKSLIRYMERDGSAKEDIMSTNMNVPRSLGGDYRPVYAITREALPENMADYKGQPTWMRLSKNEAVQVVTGVNKKNGFAEDGTFKGTTKTPKPGEQLSLPTKEAAQPLPHQAVPFTIRSDANMLWLKSASDPNIARLYRQFAEETSPKLLENLRPGDVNALQSQGYKAFKNPTPEFISWLKEGRGRIGVKEETPITDISGMRMGEQVMMFDPANILPAALLETPNKSLSYSADVIADSLSVGELPTKDMGMRVQEAYQQTNDKFQPLNSSAPVGKMTPSYFAARLYPGTDGMFLHWMEHGTTLFGKISNYGDTPLSRPVAGPSYKSILTDGVKGGHALKKAVLSADDNNAIGVFKEALRENDKLTVSEIRAELSQRLADGDISKKAYKSAIKRLEKDFDSETDLAKYGENDPLFFFRTYITAKHIANLADRGVIAGPDLAAARSIANNKIFQQYLEPAAQAYREYNKSLQQYKYDSGLISKKQLENMALQNPDYVPLNRVIEGQGEYKSTGGYALKGSARRIIDPLESTIRQTQHILKQAERNQVLRLVAEQFGENVKTNKDPNAGPGISTLAKMDASVAKTSGSSSGNTIKYMEKGVEKTAIVPPLIQKTANMLDPVSSNVLVNLAGGLTSINRAGIILHPAFALRNLTRDQISAAINSSADTKPWFGFLRGLGDIIISDKNKISQKLFPNAERYHAEWLRHSGAISNLVSQNRKYSQEMINSLLKANNTVNSIPLTEQALSTLTKYLNPLNIAAKGYKGLQRLSELSEEGTRMGEYIANRKAGVSPMESAMRSREVTIDFARSGATIKGLNAISLFLNAKVQGADKSVRQAISEPQQTAARTLAYIVVPTVLLSMVKNDYLYNAPDSEVSKQLKQVPDWQNQTYWIVPSDRGIFRIPKPQEMGIPLANPVESFIDYMYEQSPDKNFLENLYSEGYFGTVADQFFLSPDSWVSAVTPSALSPIVAVGFNMDPFTRTPIIPPEQEKLLPEARHNRNTTELAKRVTYALKSIDPLFDTNYSRRFQSPQSIDYLIQAYGGTIGKELWSLLDTAAQKAGIVDTVIKPADQLADTWFIKSFMIKYPNAGAKSITDFYTKSDELEMNLNTIKAHMKTGTATSIEKAKSLMIDASYGRLTAIRSLLSGLNREIQRATISSEFTAEEKRQIIDGMYIQMIEVSDQGLEMIKAIDRATEERKKQAQLLGE